MYSLQVIALAALVLGFVLTAIISDSKKRALVLDRVLFGWRRPASSSSSYTPPQSLSPKQHSLPTNEGTDYQHVYPPHRRHALERCKLGGSGLNAEQLSRAAPHYSRALPDDVNTKAIELRQHVTATGFTVDDIERLGDFPDYSMLSGVPLPAPYPEFDINAARPRPYRPLRWAYHQTMSLTKIEPDWWLELESTYAARVAQRQALYRQYGDMVLQSLPGSELATKELMEMCLQFLCARYPQYFRLDLQQMIFYNEILNTTTNLKTEDPLHVLLNNVPEDFACVIREPESGLYTFRAGVICSSLGWSVGSKIGLKLHEIHEPIPDYKEKMRFSMDRYFAKMPTDKPIQRGSWGLEVDQPLFMPPGDPHEKLRHNQDPEHTLARCNLRVDWQTLRRLPLSGSIVFNFKALFTPVTDFRDEPYIPALLAKVLREGKRNLMDYKNTFHTEHIVIPAMEQYAQEQVEKGLVPPDWEPVTLEESPYFPGWKEKWHRQQGF